MRTLKCGDVVRLKSDMMNQMMTVEKIDGKKVDTIWFDRESKLQRGRFEKDTLIFVKH